MRALAGESGADVNVAYESGGAAGFLMQQLVAMNQEQKRKAFAFIGAGPRQGVTTVLDQIRAFSAIVGADSRMLMIDANFAHPQLHEIFSCSRAPGLVQVLAGERSLEETIIDDEISGIAVLPAGKRKMNPGFFHLQIKELLKKARDKYQFVLIDLPPLSSQPEVLAFCRESDCTLMVVASEMIHAKAAERVKNLLTCYGCRIGGVVLNRYRHVVPRWLY